MTKQEFLKKHDLSERDFADLKRYEAVMVSGKHNMFGYLALMQKHNANGGRKLALWIMHGDNYSEFLEVLENEKNSV